INKLRIQYIVNKLKSDPDYLNYKISYLAEECGFSSHSKFSASFKNVTGLSPSTFISNLTNNKL
ncbi:helix-turn-helix domain-containing protein, partial [Xanthomarina sp.]|uniref:helix-turn-helix domain-containing protein n=1 Tax=Xanthomarina sp. TaxID=1931211 RepID=UPI002C42B3BD